MSAVREKRDQGLTGESTGCRNKLNVGGEGVRGMYCSIKKPATDHSGFIYEKGKTHLLIKILKNI